MSLFVAKKNENFTRAVQHRSMDDLTFPFTIESGLRNFTSPDLFLIYEVSYFKF